jgi:hypothetical protein
MGDTCVMWVVGSLRQYHGIDLNTTSWRVCMTACDPITGTSVCNRVVRHAVHRYCASKMSYIYQHGEAAMKLPLIDISN